MIAVVVKCGKNDYMVIDDREWSSFNNSIKSLRRTEHTKSETEILHIKRQKNLNIYLRELTQVHII